MVYRAPGRATLGLRLMAAQTDDRTQQLLDALASPVRREILWLVWDRELAAGEIAAAFPLTAPTISTHLAVLRRAGLVTMTRSGTFRRYRAVTEALKEVQNLLGPQPEKYRSRGVSVPLAEHRTVGAVVATAEVPCSRAAAFAAFTDEALYSRWMGVPVTLRNGQFSMLTEWGLRVRGRYEHVVAPALIVMRWDFQRGEIPLPGDGFRAYLELEPVTDAGGERSRVEVTQLVRSEEEGRYMERAWGLVLARFADHVLDALDPTVDIARRLPTGDDDPRPG